MGEQASEQARLLAEESFRHVWESSDEQMVDGAWTAGRTAPTPDDRTPGGGA